MYILVVHIVVHMIYILVVHIVVHIIYIYIYIYTSGAYSSTYNIYTSAAYTCSTAYIVLYNIVLHIILLVHCNHKISLYIRVHMHTCTLGESNISVESSSRCLREGAS